MTLATPDISVVMPARNVAPWVGDALESILADDGPTLEVIVVDDGSTDGTQRIVKSFADRDPRVQLFDSIGEGGAQARNFGSSLAVGRYLAFCDADDLVAQRAYSRLLAAADSAGADVTIGNFAKFSSSRLWYPTINWPGFATDQESLDLNAYPSILRHRACWNRIFLRSFWEREGLYFPSVRRSNDIVPMTKALLRAARVTVVADVVYLYRDRPGAGSMTAAAGELASADSYFRQEAECAVLVAGQGSPALSREYTLLILAADGYVHLTRALRGLARSDEPSHLSRNIATILRNLDTTAADEVRPARQWMFFLAAIGAWREAHDLLLLIDAKEPPTWPAEVIIDWLLRSDPATTPHAQAWMIDHFLLPQLSGLSAEDAAPLASKLLSLSPLFGRLLSRDVALGQTPLQQRIAAAVALAPESTIAIEMQRTTLRARARGATLADGRLDLTFRLPLDASKAVLFARSGDARDIELAALDPALNLQSLRLRLREFPFTPGVWMLWIRVVDAVRNEEIPLALTKAVSTESRLSKWSLAARRRRPTDQVLVVRDGLHVRALRRTRRAK